MRRIIYIFYAFLALLLCSNVYAEEVNAFFLQHYDNRNGLSNSSINKIFNDSGNLLWIATWDGLNMYDGTTFHVFNYSKDNDSKSIGSNVIQNITEDKRGNIWISTIGGISRYKKQTGEFYNYFYDRYQQGNVSEQEYTLAVDHSGTVYCLSQKTGLSYYDAVSDTFRLCRNLQGGSKSVQLAFDDNNHLWLLNNEGVLTVYVSNGGADKFRALRSYREKKGEVNNFFVVNHQVIYTTADGQLFSVDDKTLAGNMRLVLPHFISAVTFYKNHYLFAWGTKGYGVYDSTFHPSSFLLDETKKMQDIKITSLSAGTEDILWYGTDGNGLIKIYPKTKSFGTVVTSEDGMPYNKSVRAFCEENGNLWAGTKGSGITIYRDFWSTANIRSKKQIIIAPSQLDNNAIYALQKGTDNLIYIGTDAKGIGIYDLKNKVFVKWSQVQGHDIWPVFGSVYAICQDPDQSLWLGTSGYGLIHLKVNSDQKGHFSIGFLEKYTFKNSDLGPANDIIYSIADGNNNQLLIGCRYGGLSLLDKKTKKFRSLKAFTYEGSLSNNDVLSVFKDSHDRIWVGTSYGLNMIGSQAITEAEPIFRKLTTVNGLPNNTIHAIEEDGSGQVWVSTNKGLAKVDPATLKIAYYQQSDGLQSNEFCDGAAWKDHQGNLFFGGTYGFNNFSPRDIHKTSWLPNLCISDFSIGGKVPDNSGYIILSPLQNRPPTYTIDRKDNFFELNVKALSFLNADKCEYAYFLEGYDKVWHYVGANGKIIYSNVLPGTYNLKIKWSNGDGAWTKEATLMKLNVKEYLWLRSYAFLLYAVLLALIAKIVYRYRKNKQEMKHQLEMEHMMRTKEDEVHQNRLGFFTNIAHELQTPLTLIMGAGEWLLNKPGSPKPPKEKAYFLSQIYQQASKLTYMVHQLLEFRKIEAGFFENQYSYINITELLRNLVGPFIVLGEQHGIKSTLDICPKMLGEVDMDKLEKIIFNLLSNAFKYSARNEKINFSAKINEPVYELEITVANSGIQLTEKQLSQLFDKFYVTSKNTLNTDKFGTGIGLAFTRQLVNLLNGSITATNENNWICFTVRLPLPLESNNNKNEQVIYEQPSFLYKTITGQNEPVQMVSSLESNKNAIIEGLLQEKKSVLIVEDEPQIRYLLRDVLKEDYIIYEAEDGEQALEWTGKMLPDIVVCDVMMPKLDGLELCNRMKNAPATCQIPFILLSAKGSEEQHMEGYEVGADAYIAKPFNTAHLKIRIRKLLEYRQKLHDLFKDNNITDIRNEPDIPDSDKEFLTKVVQVIGDNLELSELNSAFLEKEFCMSRMQLYRKLKTLTGMTPGEFIKHLRLKEAAKLLTTTHLTVLEIFFRTGFNNQSYFFREFKKRYHLAPGEYREQMPMQK